MSSAVTVEVGEVRADRVLPLASPLHTIVLLVILFGGAGWMYFSTAHANASAEPSRVALYGTTIVWEWLLAAYVLFGLRKRGKALSEATGARWRTARDVLRDIGIALAFWIVALLILGLVAVVLRFHGSRETVSAMAPEGAVQITLWILLCLTAGFCEETIFRGYLQKQVHAWTGSAPAGIVLSAAVFGICHIYQGVKAVVVITVYGLLFGILAYRRKSMRPGMMAHALHDTVSGLALRFLPK
jgi:membrane protease YdiL (CAAX protease family)